MFFFFFKQKTAYEIYQCDWSSDVCSSDLSNRLVFPTLVSSWATCHNRDRVCFFKNFEPGEEKIGRASCRERV